MARLHRQAKHPGWPDRGRRPYNVLGSHRLTRSGARSEQKLVPLPVGLTVGWWGPEGGNPDSFGEFTNAKEKFWKSGALAGAPSSPGRRGNTHRKQRTGGHPGPVSGGSATDRFRRSLFSAEPSLGRVKSGHERGTVSTATLDRTHHDQRLQLRWSRPPPHCHARRRGVRRLDRSYFRDPLEWRGRDQPSGVRGRGAFANQAG